MKTYKIAVVEDDDEVRCYLADTISEHELFEVIAAASTLAEARQQLTGLQPDVVLVDLGLPDGSGVELIKELRVTHPLSQCLVITGFNDEKHVFSALEAGARGYQYKHENDQEIIRSLFQLIDGGAPISPIIAKLLLNRFSQKPGEPELSLSEGLTERELTVLNLVSRGFIAKEIAGQLGISYYTVTTHVKNIYRKLEVNNRSEALFEANHLGILGSRPDKNSK